ncbi:hypothetical protein HVX57_00430 [Klebsiella michiganensis]|uniref:primase 1D-like protein n=1 Tax=Klebsiella michiganensis TaxID=1134687 RepID=UPI0015E4BD79|nr:hypothetical protein [Klebsiella michiganensis]MBA8304378.1 hypothetical protein [Klebsiella michiganensis]MDH1343182.1 hypothetical protein [Klebsiella michiganensis]QLP34033.1 hypothetical protein HVX57_00430 [Klebsiella michiganensis]WFX47678.1 hypothetical protein NFK05_00430 [Klebsiella michiganensis]WFX53342.1 hypothetical protein NFK06_00430 [Klebsiella michiganensis]
MYDSQLFHTYINRHPVVWVRDILNFYINSGFASQNISLSFSKYIYKPQSFSDKREIFTLPFHQFSEISLFNIISELRENEELAFHSYIQDFGNTYHLPLIDFGNVDRGIIDSEPLRELAQHWGLSFSIYNSGRSFHAYANKLLSLNDWIKFMGSLLLLNKPSGFKLIDERWVGHRIMANYAALRWSHNTAHYKKTPMYVGFLNSEGLFLEDPKKVWPPVPPTL